MSTVTAENVLDKLQQWESGQIAAAEIHKWAEARFATDLWETESPSVNEVLARLDMLDMNLITVEDVPALRQALKSAECLLILDHHFSNIDIARRKMKYASDPLYALFCR